MTGYGLTGPMTARGTVFAAKTETTDLWSPVHQQWYITGVRCLLVLGIRAIVVGR